MIKFKVEEFYHQNYCIAFNFPDYKIVMGSIFNEITIINNFMDDVYDQKTKMEVDEVALDNFFPVQINLGDEMRIREIYHSTDLVIITNLHEMLALPYLIKRFNLNTKFIATEPLIQIGLDYLQEFYKNFNRILINNTESNYYVNEDEVNNFIISIQKLNYNEIYSAIHSTINITLTSSGYELGSSNVNISYFNTKVTVLSYSSCHSHRYPKEFEVKEDTTILIQMPNIINYDNDYESNLISLLTHITRIMNKVEMDSIHYPSILLVTDPFFLLDFVDLIRYKFPPETRNIYVSKSIKAIIEYANISHGFISRILHKKVYDFKLPFSFDELYKSNSLYYFDEFESLLKTNLISSSSMSRNVSPVIFMVNKLSFATKGIQSLCDSFILNASKSDCFVYLNRCIKTITDKVNTIKLHLDYRITQEQLKNILSLFDQNVKYYFPFNEQIVTKGTSYKMGEEVEIELNKDDIAFPNCYIEAQSGNLTKVLVSNSALNPSKTYDLDIKRENDTFVFNLREDNMKLVEENDFEILETQLKKLLSLNDMKINEFLVKETNIKISITKENDSNTLQTFADVDIKLKPDLEISIDTENYEDVYYLNNIIQALFNN